MSELPIRWYKYNQDSGKFDLPYEPPQHAGFGDREIFPGLSLSDSQLEQVRAIVQEELVKAGVIRTGFKGGLKG